MGQITYTTNNSGNITISGSYLYSTNFILTNTGSSAATFNLTYMDDYGEDSGSVDLVDGDLFN